MLEKVHHRLKGGVVFRSRRQLDDHPSSDDESGCGLDDALVVVDDECDYVFHWFVCASLYSGHWSSCGQLLNA